MEEAPGSGPFPRCGRPLGHGGYPGRCVSEAAWRRQLARGAAVKRGEVVPLRPGRVRRVALTFGQSRGGVVAVCADGVQVGEIIGRGRRRTAVLWPSAGRRPRLRRDRRAVSGQRLGEVKAALRIQLETGGPWWTDAGEAAA